MADLATHEPEITQPVDLCTAGGRLNPAAVGWSRHPVHRANLRGWGRGKRWEYWCVQAPGRVLALTVSSLDYLALHTVWLLDEGGTEVERTAIVPLARGVALPERCGAGEVEAAGRGLSIRLTPVDGGMRLRARTARLDADVLVRRPEGHESLGVVIPWSPTRFQYTVKENTLPAEGEVHVDGRTLRFDSGESWAVLDHGRGRWPYRTTWNWGSGSGTSDGRTIGLQLGGRWTDGTGMTENALCVDGRLHKVGEDLRWTYDRSDWTSRWRVTAPRTGRVDLTLTPVHERRARTELAVIGTEVHQCFGTWSGSVVTDDGHPVAVRDVAGFAEEARMRW